MNEYETSSSSCLCLSTSPVLRVGGDRLPVSILIFGMPKLIVIIGVYLGESFPLRVRPKVNRFH